MFHWMSSLLTQALHRVKCELLNWVVRFTADGLPSFFCVEKSNSSNFGVTATYRRLVGSVDHMKHLSIRDALHAVLECSLPSSEMNIDVEMSRDETHTRSISQNWLIHCIWKEANEALIDYDQTLHNHLDCFVSVGPCPIGQNTNVHNSVSAGEISMSPQDPLLFHRYLVNQRFFCHFVSSQTLDANSATSSATRLRTLGSFLSPGFPANHLGVFIELASHHDGNTFDTLTVNRY